MLELNGIQHYIFCKRQWALIAIESQWEENQDTLVGRYVHENVDDPYYEEKRRNKIIVRAMPIKSKKLGFIGRCDVVEFIQGKRGVNIKNYEGMWQIRVVEYKKGKPKRNDSDICQVVAQVMSLEEMFNTHIEKAYIYYKGTNCRVEVEISDELRRKVLDIADDMREMYLQKTTPKSEYSKKCTRCSLKEKCMPRLTGRKKSVLSYINKHMEEL